MITQNLNLNVRFLIMLFFWTFDIFAFMHETNLSRPNDTGKFSEFFLRVRGDPNDEIDHKRKICSTIRFFDMISQSLNLSLFATYKLIKRPLPFKRQGGNFLNFSSGLEETIMIRLITKEKYVLRFDFLIWSFKIWIWAFLVPISW